MLHFRNEEIHELPENEKRGIEQPFSPAIIFQFSCPHLYTNTSSGDDKLFILPVVNVHII